MQEKPRHRRYYEYYFQLPYQNPPQKRTLTAVAHKFNITKQWVCKLAQEFNWDQRCTRRDREIMEQLEQEIGDKIIRWKKKCFDIIDRAIEENTDISVTKAHELKSLIESGLKLIGEPERHKVTKEETITKISVQDLVDALAEE